MITNHIIPTIFATSFKDFDKRFKKLVKISKNLQIDFMDGKFVSSKSIPLSAIPDLKKYKNNFEAHLMVENPDSWVVKLKLKGFKKVIFHYESIPEKVDIVSLINKIKSLGMEAFIAIRPDTSINNLEFLASLVDGVLLMGVVPGKEGQPLVNNVYHRINQLVDTHKSLILQVDGGVTFETAKKLIKAGASLLNSGSLIYKSANPKKTIKELNDLFK